MNVLLNIIYSKFSLKESHITNRHSQNNKQHSSILTTFHHLILFNLTEAHVNYAKKFLRDKNTHLPCLLDLCIGYELLVMVTRHNCTKLKELKPDPLVQPKIYLKHLK